MLVAVGRAGGAGADPSRPRPKEPEVLVTTALTGDGIPALMDALDRHRAKGRDTGDTPARLARAEAHVWSILADRLRGRLHEPGHAQATTDTMRQVAAHELDPFAAADRLLADLHEQR
jgi:LAO/AO transport system kinase